MMRYFLALVGTLLSLCALAQPNAPDIVVSKDGKGAFTTIQEAILSVRDYKPTRTTIYVKNGRYEEKLHIPANKCDITIIGQSQEGVVITHGDYAKLNNMGTFNTWTVRVDGDGIRMENMTIENSAGPVGQAVALHVEGDRCEFAKCRLLGFQDTLFNGGNGSRQYFKECYVEGTTDFIFGPATVVMDNCELHCKADSYITAASTPRYTRYGYVMRHCTVTAEADVTKLYLGRPWREFAAVAWIECELPGCIRPEGWHNWGRTENEHTARYAEYNCTGEGANTDGRVAWARQLSAKQAARMTFDKIFHEKSDWTPGFGIHEDIIIEEGNVAEENTVEENSVMNNHVKGDKNGDKNGGKNGDKMTRGNKNGKDYGARRGERYGKSGNPKEKANARNGHRNPHAKADRQNAK